MAEIGYVAIESAAAGQVQLSPQAAARLMREVRVPESPEALTQREIEVLRLLAHVLANKEIAREWVSTRNVRECPLRARSLEVK